MNAILLMKLLDLMCRHCDELSAHWIGGIFVEYLEGLEIWTRLHLFLLEVFIYVLTAVLTSIHGIRGLPCLLHPIINLHHLVPSSSVTGRVQGLMISIVVDAEPRLSLLSVPAVVTALLWDFILCLHPSSYPLLLLLLIMIQASNPSEDLIKEWHAAEAGDKRCRRVETRHPVVQADVQVICLQDILLRRLMPAIWLLSHLLICELAGLPGAYVAFEVRLLIVTLIINPVLIPPVQVLVQATGRSVNYPQQYLIVYSTISVQGTAI
jgi:hypothetical protein